MKVGSPSFWVSCTATWDCRGPTFILSWTTDRGLWSVLIETRKAAEPCVFPSSWYCISNWRGQLTYTPCPTTMTSLLFLGKIDYYFLKWPKMPTDQLCTGPLLFMLVGSFRMLALLISLHHPPIVSPEYRCGNRGMDYLVLCHFYFQIIFIDYILFGTFFRLKLWTNIKSFVHFLNFCSTILISLKVRLMPVNHQGKRIRKKMK